MKKIIIHTLIWSSLMLVGTSCEDWLNVQPKTEIKSEMVFDKPVYFEQALIGVYLSIAERDLYGEQLTFYFMDVIADLYDIDNFDADYYKSGERDYQDLFATGIINEVWNNAYNAVTNINNLLENVEKQSVVPEVTAKMIKGEALGLRAFLHFDLLRMFGPANLSDDASKLSRKIIPYVLEYDKQLSPQLSIAQTLEKIYADLDESITLLEENDPWGVNKAATVDEYADELFYQNRKFRFNYWAAIATKARVLMWEGNYREALALAEKFIAESPIQFVQSSDLEGEDPDRSFSREYIFGLEVHNLFVSSDIKTYFGTQGSAATSNQMYVKGTRFANIYETESVGSSDFRQLYKFADKEFDKILNQYAESDNYGNRVALIRKPEMYYIAAECLLRLEERKADALNYLEQVRRSRTLVDEFSPDLSDDELFLEILKEYYKDFFGEGQIFYFQKRLGASLLPYTNMEVSEESYILPIPQEEIDFGRISNTEN